MSAKILIIDDAPEIVSLLEDLMTVAGYQTDSAPSAEQGLIKVEHFNPDLILLDLMLPKMDGFTFCKKLKSDEATKPIKIIMVSVLRDPKDIKKGQDVGADDYITKPFNPDDLLKRIKALLG